MSSPTSESVIVCSQSGPLSGKVTVPGAKNSVLKLMAATLLADGVYELRNVPDITDVDYMTDLLVALGLDIERGDRHRLRIVNSGRISPVVPFALADRIRASVNVLGPLIGRFGDVQLALPGGDDFGGRPIDMHLSGLEAMGAQFELTDDGVLGRTSGRLKGADITFAFPSVGATENILMAAVVAEGVTTISNAAREPEIGDLCAMLQSMGAHIDGVGTSTLVIRGVSPASMQSCVHAVVSDRVQAATYIAAVAMCGGDIEVQRAVPSHMEMLLTRYADMGMSILPIEDGLRVSCHHRLSAIDVATLPYPGIATDYKPLLVAMLATSDGTGIVTENLYPGRFRYIEELRKLGADISVDGHHAVVRGRDHLVGATVVAPDIRAGAALVVAGLAAQGMTEIHDVHHIDRGYDDLVGRLANLGGSINRIG
jgi:UDP-N-acetylglucosamine 1-carboxyvinyltransferase